MRKWLKRLFILLVILVILSLYSYFKLDITYYEVVNSKIPNSFNNYKILLLSDLHDRDLKDKINEICKEEKPDIIVMSGDMANYNGYNKFFELVKSLNKYDIYYVTGNHEQDMNSKVYDKFIDELDKYVNILDNEMVEIYEGEDHINLYGLNYPLRYYSKKGMYNLTDDNISARIGKADKKEYNILLTHNPLYYDTYSEWGSDLTLSGHVHGGIVRIPFAGGLLSPDFTFFPKYSEGKNKINDMDLIISRGLGNGGQIKVRINNHSEVVIVKLEVK